MRTIGWLVTWILGIVFWLTWLIGFSPLSPWVGASMGSFLSAVWSIIVTMVIVVGSFVAIAGIAYLIWRPDKNGENLRY